MDGGFSTCELRLNHYGCAAQEQFKYFNLHLGVCMFFSNSVSCFPYWETLFLFFSGDSLFGSSLYNRFSSSWLWRRAWYSLPTSGFISTSKLLHTWRTNYQTSIRDLMLYIYFSELAVIWSLHAFLLCACIECGYCHASCHVGVGLCGRIASKSHALSYRKKNLVCIAIFRGQIRLTHRVCLVSGGRLHLVCIAMNWPCVHSNLERADQDTVTT